MDACAHGVHILAYECFCVFFSVVFVAHFDALMTGVGGSHIKHCGFPTQIQKTNNSLAPDGTIFSIMTSALCGCPLLLSSGIKMCNKHLQQKKRSISWNVYSLSLTHTHTHTHTHRQLDIHAQGVYIEYCCSLGSFGAKCLFIFETFV